MPAWPLLHAQLSPSAMVGRVPLAATGSGGVQPPGRLLRRYLLLLCLAVAGSLGLWAVGWGLNNYQKQEHVLQEQQGQTANFIANSITQRIEQQLRVLAALSQGWPVAALASPAQLDALLRREAPLARLFEQLQVAWPDGTLQQYAAVTGNGMPPSLGAPQRDVLRRSLADGKPAAGYFVQDGTQDLHLQLTWPLRGADGSVAAVLAGSVRLAPQSLLPATQPGEVAGMRYLVLAEDGSILAHSDPGRWLASARSEPGLEVLPATPEQWPTGLQAQTWRSDRWLVTAVGLPLARWQVVVVQDLGSATGWRRWLQLPDAPLFWAALAAWLALLGALAWWWAQPLHRLQRMAAQSLRQSSSRADMAHLDDDELEQVRSCLQWLAREREVHRGRWRLLRSQYQSLLESTPVGVLVTREARMLMVSGPLGRMLGYETRQLQGQPLRRLLAGEEAYADMQAQLQRALTAFGVWDHELCLLRQDGSPAWVRVRCQRIHGHEGSLVWIVEDASAQRLARQQPDWSSLHDGLTQLSNRRAFTQHLAQWWQECSQALAQPGAAGSPPGEAALLFLDVDHFATVNDLGGRDAGDAVLRHLARMFEHIVGPLGSLARMGGDEFAVLLPGGSLAQAQGLAQQLCQAVLDWQPVCDGQSLWLSLSVGVVAVDVRTHGAADALHAADMACYDAKRRGRNQVMVRHVVARPASPPLNGRENGREGATA